MEPPVRNKDATEDITWEPDPLPLMTNHPPRVTTSNTKIQLDREGALSQVCPRGEDDRRGERTDNQCRSDVRVCSPLLLILSLLSSFQLALEHLSQESCPISGNLILNGISLSRGAPGPFHYPPPHLKRPRLRSTKPRVKRKKGGRQEKKNLLRYTDYNEQEENDGLHHTSPWTIPANNV
jgi:hypothetical protein